MVGLRNNILVSGCDWITTIDGRTELFLAIEPEVSYNDYQLADQSNPERRISHRAAFQSVRLEVPCGDVREDGAGTDPVWSSRTGNHDTDRTNGLCEGQSGADMETRQGLEQNHTQTNTLDGI